MNALFNGLIFESFLRFCCDWFFYLLSYLWGVCWFLVGGGLRCWINLLQDELIRHGFKLLLDLDDNIGTFSI